MPLQFNNEVGIYLVYFILRVWVSQPNNFAKLARAPDNFKSKWSAALALE
jgi:hypothetical protein